MDNLADCIELATGFGCTVSVGAEDASQTGPDFFLRVADTAAELGRCGYDILIRLAA
ncbi:MAG: hypothetical protein ABFC57_17735 [Veillonellales bacterium]